mmetsp:Transcript_5668/g.21458  ORF Transcript_5668/g.21458 Transcript_5668/m.21458 type:complete len:301 (-) Transcript_5668:230-1132(-)
MVPPAQKLGVRDLAVVVHRSKDVQPRQAAENSSVGVRFCACARLRIRISISCFQRNPRARHHAGHGVSRDVHFLRPQFDVHTGRRAHVSKNGVRAVRLGERCERGRDGARFAASPEGDEISRRGPRLIGFGGRLFSQTRNVPARRNGGFHRAHERCGEGWIGAKRVLDRCFVLFFGFSQRIHDFLFRGIAPILGGFLRTRRLLGGFFRSGRRLGGLLGSGCRLGGFLGSFLGGLLRTRRILGGGLLGNIIFSPDFTGRVFTASPEHRGHLPELGRGQRVVCDVHRIRCRDNASQRRVLIT